MSERGRLLVLTVGTGNTDQLETTLFRPLEKSVRDGDWAEVVLLPSSVTSDFARRFAASFPDLAFRIEALPEDGMENDADACFGHFDRVLGGRIRAGRDADSITADFTRGTKAMSAALVLAAVRRGVPRLRYIRGARDQRGMVQPGLEEIAEIRTALATGKRLLDEVRRLMRSGDFAAVPTLLPDTPRLLDELAKEGERLRRQAAFYGAWDRLDYARASSLADHLEDESGDTAEAAAWVRRLAEAPERTDHQRMAERLRAVACDLLENGRRRIRDGLFEDSLVRAYRVRELIGQISLFDRGVDSASIDPGLSEVRSLQRRLQKKRSENFGVRRDGRLTAGKFVATRLLKEMKERIGETLLDFDAGPGGLFAGRNYSILIHGFETQAPTVKETMEDLYARLQTLLCEGFPDAEAMIRAARRCAVSD